MLSEQEERPSLRKIFWMLLTKSSKDIRNSVRHQSIWFTINHCVASELLHGARYSSSHGHFRLVVIFTCSTDETIMASNWKRYAGVVCLHLSWKTFLATFGLCSSWTELLLIICNWSEWKWNYSADFCTKLKHFLRACLFLYTVTDIYCWIHSVMIFCWNYATYGLELCLFQAFFMLKQHNFVFIA